jgi:hypothetical protein
MQALMESDLAIFIGKNICKEANPYRQHNFNLYFDEFDDGILSLALGVAMGTDKKVFVFCEDQYFIRNMSEFLQSSVSKCKNLFFILLINGSYTEVPNTPTIFNSVSSQHGILYSMGFLIHDYNRFFKASKNPVNAIKEYWSKATGPLVVLLKTEIGSKAMDDIEFVNKESLLNTKEFIIDKTIKGHNYTPPLSLEGLNLEV